MDQTGVAFLDIIFFAMVAGFLILRLRSVLGRRTGDENAERWKPRRRPRRAAWMPGSPRSAPPTRPSTRAASRRARAAPSR
jgi:hypothetical protein